MKCSKCQLIVLEGTDVKPGKFTKSNGKLCRCSQSEKCPILRNLLKVKKLKISKNHIRRSKKVDIVQNALFNALYENQGYTEVVDTVDLTREPKERLNLLKEISNEEIVDTGIQTVEDNLKAIFQFLDDSQPETVCETGHL